MARYRVEGGERKDGWAFSFSAFPPGFDPSSLDRPPVLREAEVEFEAAWKADSPIVLVETACRRCSTRLYARPGEAFVCAACGTRQE